MSRIPYPALDQLSPVKHARIFDPKRKYVLNVSKMALHVPDALWLAQAELGRVASTSAEIDPRLREIVIIRLAHLMDSEYELFHHRSIARHVGVSDAEIAALEGGDLSLFGPADRAMIDYASEVLLHVSPSDETLAAVRAHFADSTLFEVIAMMGSYMITARVAAVGGVELDAAPVTTW